MEFVHVHCVYTVYAHNILIELKRIKIFFTTVRDTPIWRMISKDVHLEAMEKHFRSEQFFFLFLQYNMDLKLNKTLKSKIYFTKGKVCLQYFMRSDEI